MSDELKNRGYKLVNFIEEKTGVRIKLVYAPPKRGENHSDEGQTICKNELILVYTHPYIMKSWTIMREIIVHEAAHRLDHLKRGNMHHNPRYEHDIFFWGCYHDVMRIAKNSDVW